MSVKKQLFILFFLVAGVVAQQPEEFEIKTTTGVYPLNFDGVYSININNDYGTLIEPPEGYKLLDVALGSSKYYSSELVNNSARIKKIAPDNARSNVHLILKGPDGMPRSVTIELTGESQPKVATVKFMIPTNREQNAQLEQMKAKYTDEMNQKLSAQERTLKKIVDEETMKNVELFRFNSYPSGTSKKELGAHVYLDNIANSKGKGYVYLSTTAEDPTCQVVQLQDIKGKDISKRVKLVDSKVVKGITHYVYETSPFTKTNKKYNLKFNILVYQKSVTIKASVL